ERDWTGVRWCDWVNDHLPPESGDLIPRLARFLGLGEDDDVIARLEWLGLASDRRVGDIVGTPVDVLARRLERKLVYEPGERDMVVLEHHFGHARLDGTPGVRTSRLLMFGDAGDDSALAQTVSLPAAIACTMLLDGQVSMTGVRIPTDPRLAASVLSALADRGIRLVDV